MMPIGPLMKEHRVIERMIAFLQDELQKIEAKGAADLAFFTQAVDFVRSYADHCHHGKEEDILFKALQKKPLNEEDRKIMGELVLEHIDARRFVQRVEAALAHLRHGDPKALNEMKEALQGLIALYPKHIEKEDKHFFIPAMGYFDAKEQAAMLEKFRAFDAGLIHEKYKLLVEEHQKSRPLVRPTASA